MQGTKARNYEGRSEKLLNTIMKGKAHLYVCTSFRHDDDKDDKSFRHDDDKDNTSFRHEDDKDDTSFSHDHDEDGTSFRHEDDEDTSLRHNRSFLCLKDDDEATPSNTHSVVANKRPQRNGGQGLPIKWAGLVTLQSANLNFIFTELQTYLGHTHTILKHGLFQIWDIQSFELRLNLHCSDILHVLLVTTLVFGPALR